ncbi:MAG TPA: hypothetical protein VND19_01295 [Acetobacteraceae bacterium]|nr:hypothetical protein [Acetobacteraceae bacterium]
MATYKQIAEYAWWECQEKIHHPCWIADVKARHGLTTRLAHNRQRADRRAVPCPSTKVVAIEAALRHYGMI